MKNTNAYTKDEWKRTPMAIKKYIESLESIIESQMAGKESDWELTKEMLKVLKG